LTISSKTNFNIKAMKKKLLIVLFILLNLFQHLILHAQWTQTNGPNGAFITSLAVSGTNVFAGTDEAGVYLSTNSGSSWTLANNGLTNKSVTSLAVIGSNIFAGTDDGVFRSTNNGSSWTAVNSGLTDTNIRSLAVSDTNIFAVTAFDGVFRSTNNGSSWAAVTNALADAEVLSLTASGTNIFADTNEGVFLSIDTGNSWTLKNTGLLNDYVYSLAIIGTNIFAGTGGGGVYKRSICEMTLGQAAISASGSTTICQGGSVTLTSSAANSYLWSNGATTQNITASAAGNYTVTISDGMGCSTISTPISVTVNPLPTVTANASATTVCAGQSVTLTGSGNANAYAWSGGVANGAAFVPTTTNSYTVTGTNSSTGCQNTATATITVNPLPAAPTVAAQGSTSLCPGGSVTLNATNICSGCTVTWSNGQSGTSITASTAGTYTALVGSPCGNRPASNAVNVTVGTAPAAPTVAAQGSTSLCPGGSVTLNATNICSGCTVNWSNGQSGTSITASTAGTYTALVGSPCGNSPASNAVNVAVNSNFIPVIQVNDQCYLAAPAGSNYQWFFYEVIIPNANGQFCEAKETGYYIVKVNNPAGCSGVSDPVYARICMSAVDDLPDSLVVALYPNPAVEKVFLRIQSNENLPNSSFELYAVDGRRIGQLYQGGIASDGQVLELALPNVPAGLYWYRLVTLKGIVNGNLIISTDK